LINLKTTATKQPHYVCLLILALGLLRIRNIKYTLRTLKFNLRSH